jgi:rhodanese-related sulfurtransferase
LLLDYNYDDITVVDVRKQNEYEAGHVEGAVNVVLQEMDEQLPKLEHAIDDNLYVYCEGGFRSVMAASLLKRKGFKSIRNVYGGYNAISKTKIQQELPKFSDS